MSQGHEPGGLRPPRPDPYATARAAMVEEQLVRRGVHDTRVLEAMRRVPRHRFVSADQQPLAYDDRPLPIGYGQTISQPFMVARATDLAAVHAGDKVLEVGAGCGYQSAVLAELGAQVFAIEIVPELAERARTTLKELGYERVLVSSFDGSGGWREHAPYDAIIVSAGAPRVPVMMVAQLRDRGRLVVPVGESGEEQVLTLIHRRGDRYDIVEDTPCRYVDLVGRYGTGWNPPSA